MKVHAITRSGHGVAGSACGLLKLIPTDTYKPLGRHWRKTTWNRFRRMTEGCRTCIKALKAKPLFYAELVGDVRRGGGR